MTLESLPEGLRDAIAAIADVTGDSEQVVWENAAVEYLRVLVNGRTDGYVVASVPALNLALARAERAD